MNVSAKFIELAKINADCIVLPVVDANQQTTATETIAQLGKFPLEKCIKDKVIETASGKLSKLYISELGTTCLFIGLGKPDALKASDYRKAIATAAQGLGKAYAKVSWCLDDITVEAWEEEQKTQALAQAIVTGEYQFTTCKSKPEKPKKITHTVVCSQKHLKAAKEGVKLGVAIGEGMNFTRELGNLPGNICTPTYLAKQARELTKGNDNKLSVQVLSEKQMAALGMNSLLSVSAGSKEPAQLIVMEYKGGSKSSKPHVLVGKGITFDTGGISLKPGPNMDEMKFDMCGAASVFGTMKTLLALEPKINVIGVVAAAENMPSDRATKPGDIVTSMSGQTIEILNTDAEGRLVLCDALTYVERYKPESVIDIATLTGACVIALGKHASGLYSNDDNFAKVLLEAGQKTGDRAWHMPLWDEYKKQLDSNFADMANIGSREGGSITAACFLSRFTEAYKWAHLDIAGTAWHSGSNKGATGRPVPLLVEYLLNYA